MAPSSLVRRAIVAYSSCPRRRAQTRRKRMKSEDMNMRNVEVTKVAPNAVRHCSAILNVTAIWCGATRDFS